MTWTPAQIERFKVLFRKGVKYKIIADELGVTVHTVKQRREALGLPTRQAKKNEGFGHKLHFACDARMRQKIMRRAAERGISTGHYVRSLILRDLGE